MGVPFRQILVLDYETRYSSKPQPWCPDAYTLRKSTTEEYVRSPLFKDFGASIKQFKPDAAKAQWYNPSELKRVFATYDWAQTAVVCHNAAFDCSILAWHYGIQPAFIFDTLSMSRALRGTKGRNSLDALAKDFGLPEKGTAIGLSDGLWELPRNIESQLAEYCNHDVWLCEEILKRFLAMCAGGYHHDINFDDMYDMQKWVYPIKELRLIDMTIRMFTRPLLELDGDMLQDALVEERDTREGLLKRLGITDADLASNDRFADILKGLGVEPPVKKKNATAKTPNPVGFNYAFAKNDAGFQALLAHEDDNIVSLCEARLKVKSTTERTRAQRFLDISQRGTLPVPLHYYGAATGRWAAAKGAAINMQNLKRGSFLRKAIMAPEGHVIVVVDLSQIEPRVLAWLADYDELLDIFRSGKDAYAMFGAQMFNTPGLTKETHPMLRQSSKSALLGCFGPDTKVLTQRGWVPIVSVQVTDTVWDGQEWVQHQGVLPQGEKTVLTAHGISATSDHEILTERGWAEWSEVLAEASLLRSALLSANLPASAGTGSMTSEGVAATTLSCAAVAVGKVLSIGTTSLQAGARGAETARMQKRSKLDTQHWGTRPFALTGGIGSVFSIASAPSLFAVPTRKAASTLTTAEGASRFIRHGLKTASNFFATLLGLRGGIGRSCSSTARTTAGGYEPGNLRFVTRSVNMSNKRKITQREVEALKRRIEALETENADLRHRLCGAKK